MKTTNEGSLRAWTKRQFQGAADQAIEDVLGVFREAGKPYRKQVSPVLWRGSEPTAADLKELKALGIKTVVDLRWNTEDNATLTRQAGLVYRPVGFMDGGLPSKKDIREALAVMSDPAAQPVYVHCREGIGRTGLIVACYRIAHEGLSADAAVADAKEMGLKLPWQEKYIRAFAENVSAAATATPANDVDGFEP